MSRDKITHFGVGYMVAHVAYAVTKNKILSLLLAVVAGFGWELYQYLTKRGTVELKDALATVAGGVAFICVDSI